MSITLKQASNQHAFNDIRLWYYTNDVALRDAIESHVHDGINDAKVDHTGLLNIGTLTHAELETAISTNTSNLTSHEGDTDVHIQTGERTDWDGVVTEVVAARNSAAKSTVYNTLDERLEAIENESSVTAHGSLTGLHTEATGSGDSESRHKALAIWDVTGSRTLQAAIDAMVSAISGLDTNKMDTADFATTFNAQTNGSLDGDKIETATTSVQGAVQLGVDCPELSHTHDVTDIDIDEMDMEPNGLSQTSGSVLAVTMHNLGVVLSQGIKNLLPNGTFIFPGRNPATNGIDLIDNATADLSPTLTYPRGVPGWTLERAETTTTTKLESDITPASAISPTPMHHATGNNVDFEYSYGRFQVSDSSAASSGSMVSDSFRTTAFGVTFNMKFYNRNTYTQTMRINFQEWNGSDWANVEQWGVDLPGQTWWEHGWYAGCIPGVHRIVISFDTTTSNGADVDIASIEVLNGDVTSVLGWLPRSNFYLDKFVEYAVSTTVNMSPTPRDNHQNRPLFKKTYKARFPVNSSFGGSMTLSIPKAQYVYDVRVKASWVNMTTVDIGSMPTPIPVEYGFWTSMATDFSYTTTELTSITLGGLPVPLSGTEYFSVEVEYWPADV